MTFQYASLARGTRSAGVHFDRAKWTKTRQRRGLPPPLESTPPIRGGVCAVRFSALGPVGSHRWLTSPMDGTYFYVSMFFYPQGLTLVSRCSQRSQAWLPAAGTPLLQGRPGYGNHPAIGPAAMVVWYGGSDRSHSKGHGPNTNLTHSQPSTPGGYLGGNALSGFWFLLTEQKEPPAGSVPARLASLFQEKEPPCNSHVWLIINHILLGCIRFIPNILHQVPRLTLQQETQLSQSLSGNRLVVSNSL